MNRLALCAVLAALAGACSPITRYSDARQDVGAELGAMTGATVLHLDRTRDMPNVVGRADVWGRRVNEGYLAVRYLGLVDDKPAFAVEEVAMSSNETTLSRGFAFSQGSSSFAAGPTSAFGQSGGSSFVLPPSPVQVDVGPVNAGRFVHDPAQGPLIVEGYRLTVLQATPSRLTYRIDRAGR